MPAHKNLTGTDLHEPKGADTATSGQIYVADGAGSGAWSTDYLKSSTTKNTNRLTTSLYFADLGTAGSQFAVAPLAGKIIKIYSVINASFTGSDAVLTSKIAGVSVTNGSITVTQSGSAAGDVDSATPTAANTVTAGQAIEIATDGGPSSVVSAQIVIVLDVS